MKDVHTLLTSVALGTWASLSSAGTLETIKVDVDGQKREFNLFTPDSYDPAVPMPLVFGLHGYTVDAGTHQLVTGLNPIAERRGVLVAYPQALNNNWFPGHVPGNNIDYLVKVYEAAIEHRNVNKEIVALSGLSQGATMSLTLAAARPDLFSSVVSVAGTRNFTIDDELVPNDVPEVPDRPISRLHVHGTADEFVTVDLTEDGGQVLDFPLFNHTVMDSVSTWATGLGFEGEPTIVPVEDRALDGLTSELLSFPGRTYSDIYGTEYTADTEYIRVLGGGHNWPGDWSGWPADFQPVTTDFSSSELALDFVLSHPRESERRICDFGEDQMCGVGDLDAMTAAADLSVGASVTLAGAMFDLTGDSVVDRADVERWLANAAIENGLSSPYPMGDADLNGVVQFDDFLSVSANFGKPDAVWSDGDFDGNGAVGFADFLVVSNSFGQSSLAAVSVPEPSSSVLFALTAACFTLVVRRTKSDVATV